MPNHSEGPGIWLSVWRFLLTHCLYVRAAKVLARLRGCTGSPEPSLLAQAISTKFAWRGPIMINRILHLCSCFIEFNKLVWEIIRWSENYRILFSHFVWYIQRYLSKNISSFIFENYKHLYTQAAGKQTRLELWLHRPLLLFVPRCSLKTSSSNSRYIKQLKPCKWLKSILSTQIVSDICNANVLL